MIHYNFITCLTKKKNIQYFLEPPKGPPCHQLKFRTLKGSSQGPKVLTCPNHLPSQHMDLAPFLVGCFWLILLVKRVILMQNEASNVFFCAFFAATRRKWTGDTRCRNMKLGLWLLWSSLISTIFMPKRVSQSWIILYLQLKETTIWPMTHYKSLKEQKYKTSMQMSILHIEKALVL